jgi:hypothetical protein
MDTTLDYPTASKTRMALSERINLRLIVILLLVAVPFLWCLWTIVDQRIIVKEGDYYAVDLKGMGNFPMDPLRDGEEVIPKEVRELDGKKVKFQGEMYGPNSAANEVTQFQLVYSIVECCMGGPPKVQERVFAFAKPEQRIPNYSGRQVTVIGTLHVGVQKQNGQAVSVFTMDVDEVRERT